MIYIQNTLIFIWDLFKNFLLSIVQFIYTPISYFIDIINFVLKFGLDYLNYFNSIFSQKIGLLNTYTNNYTISPNTIPSWFKSSLNFFDCFFPVLFFLTIVSAILYLWCVVFFLKFLYRIIYKMLPVPK